MTPESQITEDSTENYDLSPEETRVLVVDSDLTCLAIVSRMLEQCGYQECADDALSIAQKRKDDLHLVLMEVHLPDMNRYELLEKMAQLTNLPIVVMSSDENEKAMLGGLFKGAMLYLVKPITVSDVRNLWQFSFMKKVAERRKAEQFPAASKYRKEKRDREWAGEISDSAMIRRPKLVWTNELHNKFLEAVNDLGIDRAHPKDILHHMNVPGIRKDNISSHLQKYRLSLKRKSAGDKAFTDSPKSSLVSSSRPPLTLALRETTPRSSNQIEINTGESFVSIPALRFEAFLNPYLDPVPQTLPSSCPFLEYDLAAEFGEIGGFNGGKTGCSRNIFDIGEDFPQLPPPPSPPSLNKEMQPALPLYLPLTEEERNEGEKLLFSPPFAVSPNLNEEGNICEIGSKQIDDLYDMFGIGKGSLHDEDLDELWLALMA